MRTLIDLTNQRVIARNFIYGKQKFNGTFDIIICAKGVELTEKLKEAVRCKIGRVRRYAPRALRARVHFEREHMREGTDNYRLTVRYEIPGNDLVAEHRAAEPLTALDLVAEKIERRLRKRKTARLVRRSGRKARSHRIAGFCAMHEHWSDEG